MVNVENQKTLRLLTARFMKMNRNRNRIAVLAIMLTALLFTSLFMGAVSMILSKRATDIKQFMDSSHSTAQNLTEEEDLRIHKALEKDKNVARYGRGIFLGSIADERFGYSTEVRYGDENLAESFNCRPSSGRLPKAENEIAVSTLVLDTLGLPHKLGTEITLTWEADIENAKTNTDTFRLCGYWEGDKSVMAQIVWVSETYAEDHSSPATKETLEIPSFHGSRDYVVWYKNLWNLNKKTKQLSKAAGFTEEEIGFEVNPAYNLMEEDALSIPSLVILILLIIAAGYLIIYNIFSLSVKTDMRTYGLLKNVGTTGKQLKKIVCMQAWHLSIRGIPLGLLFGYGVGVLMAPTLNATNEISGSSEAATTTVISAHPLIFVFSVLFTLLTVYLSNLQACHMVEKVSPVEALRLSENEMTHRKVKKHSSANWWNMAIQNVLRNWKRGLIVMLSIALSLVVVNCIFILVKGYDFTSYQKIFLASDFQLDQITASASNTNFEGISPKVKEVLNACPHSAKTGYVYYSSEKHKMEPTLKKTWEEFASHNEEFWSVYEKNEWQRAEDSNEIHVHFLGINESIFDKLEWKEQPCSWKEFQSGNYIIVDFNTRYVNRPTSYYQPGERFSMTYQNGKTKNYTVLGEAMMPYSLDYPYADAVYITVIVPESEYIAYEEKSSAMYAAIDAQKGHEKEIEQYLEDKLLKQNNLINISSILDMRKSFQRYVNKYYIIGGLLTTVLSFIGIMNFFNTTATSVLSRKKELALLEVVGMTRQQLLKMLIAEGCIYLGGSLLIAILFLCLFSEKLLTKTIGNAFYFQMHLTIVPCLCMIPVLLIIAWTIPKYQFKKMSRESVVERIRME